MSTNINKIYTLADFQIGDEFQIFASPYGKVTFRVVSTDNGFLKMIDVSDKPRFTEPGFLTDVNLKYYSRFIKFTFKATPIFTEPTNQSAAITQTIGLALTFGEEAFTRTVNAVNKAADEFQNNETIDFENGILWFVSRYSNKTRIVTKDGCSDECDCRGEVSYHSELWKICAAAYPSKAVEFKPLYLCELCRKPSNEGFEHKSCMDEENFWADAAGEAMSQERAA